MIAEPMSGRWRTEERRCAAAAREAEIRRLRDLEPGATLALTGNIDFLLGRLDALRSLHDRRVQELFEKNNREVERRREAETRAADLEAILAGRDGMILRILRGALDLAAPLERHLREALGERVKNDG